MGKPPEKRKQVPAAYTQDGQPVCPHCFSKPSVRLRVDRALAGRRGASLRVSEEHIDMDGTPVRVFRTLYPCANPDCPVILVIFSTPSAVATDDRLAVIRQRHSLTEGQMHDYVTGNHDANGIWRQASLF